MSIFAVLIFTLQFPLGYLLTSCIDNEKRLTEVERCFSTIIIGPTVSCFLLLLLLLILGSWNAAIFFIWALLTATLLIGINKISLNRPEFNKITQLDFSILTSINFWIILVLFLMYAGILFGGFLLTDEGFPSVISLGWGDTSYHLSIVGRLRVSDPFVLENPIASGIDLNYTFMINLLTAFYQRIGFSLFYAWHLSNAIYGVSFFFLLYLFGKRILRSNVLSASLVAIVFFGGGIGFLLYFSDLGLAWAQGGIDLFADTIFNPPNEYTYLHNRYADKSSQLGVFHNIHWIVPAISFLSHQRTFLPGLALATVLMIGIISYRGNRQIWKWGIVLGMIPLFHTHSFIASCIILACWFLFDLRNYSAWLLGGFIGIVMSIPQILYLMPSEFSDEFSFLRPWLGWMMCTHHNDWYECDKNVRGIDTNILWFWTKNFGIVFWSWFITVLLFLLYKIRTNFKSIIPHSTIIIPSILLFVIPNLVLFQPWEFDNNKILYYWWILASICTIMLAKNLFSNRKVAIIAFTLIMVLSIFSGFVDVLSRVSKIKQNHYGYYDSNDVKIAEWINKNTIPNARFLGGDFADQYIPMLTGRSIYLGYPGWLWPRGVKALTDYRKSEAINFLSSGNPEQMCREQISYILWDRRLLSTYPAADKQKVLTSAKVVYSHNGIDVIEILCKK
jgi:hypothetical protein